MCPSITGGLESKKCAGPNCLFAHFVNQLRRPLFDHKGRLIYTSFPCQYNSSNTVESLSQCPHGDQCVYAHTENEILYHPQNYKTRQCGRKNIGECHKGKLCPDYHSNEEVARNILSIDPEAKEVVPMFGSSEEQNSPGSAN
jgi:hypothetical protein